MGATKNLIQILSFMHKAKKTDQSFMLESIGSRNKQPIITTFSVNCDTYTKILNV